MGFGGNDQVNGAIVISNWTDHAPTGDSGSIILKAGVKYPIYVTSYEAGGGATTVLMWSGPGIAKSVVGSQYLFPQGIGLKGEYFDNMDLTNLKVTRTDPRVGFDWVTGSPDPAIGPDTFSVRWTGTIRVPYLGYYTFYTYSDDGVRAWIGGQILTWNWTDHGPMENSSVPIWLPAGSIYTIKMEYYENGGGALAQLKWSSPSFSKQVIPEYYLCPQ